MATTPKVTKRLEIYAVAGTATLVMGSATQLLASSEGEHGITIDDTDVYWSGQGLVDQYGELVKRDVTWSLAGMTTEPSVLATLLNITSSATASAHDSGSTTATAYRITDTTTKQYFRIGFQYYDSDSAYARQWYAPRNQFMGSLPFAFNKSVMDTQDITIKSFAPAGGGGTVIEALELTA